MKKHSLTIIALLSLLLSGCKQQGESGSSPTTSSTTSSDVVSEIPSASSKPSESPSLSDSHSTAGEGSSSSGSTSTSSASASQDLQKNKWPKEVKQNRQQYLGGELLPYLNLGKNVTSEWVQADEWDYDSVDHLEISGTAVYDNVLTASFKTAFEADGYTVSPSDTSYTAKNTIKGLTVTLKKTADDDDTALIQAIYEEPYDPSQFTAWPSDVLESFNQYFNNHGNDIPLIYLGTKNPSVEWDSIYNKLTLKGPKWDDRILTDAKATFSGNQWEISPDSTSVKIIATKTISGDKFTITLQKASSYYSSDYQPKREIQRQEGFNPSSLTAWPDDVKTALSTALNGHVPPFVYLGTKDPTTNVIDRKKEIDVNGGTFDKQILTLADDAFNKEGGWTVKEDHSTENSPSVWKVWQKTYDDGDRVEAKLCQNYSFKKAYRAYYYHEKFDAENLTSWPSEIQTSLSSTFAGDDIPFVYLGTKTPKGDASSSGKYRTITGGYWDDQILALAEKAFTKELGWTKASSLLSSEKNGPSAKYTKYFSSTGDYIVLSFSKNYNGMAELLIECLPTSKETSWSDDIKTALKPVLGDNDIPYFYRGANKDLTVKTSGNVATIVQGTNATTSKLRLDYFSGSFKSAGWTVSENREEDEDDRDDYSSTYTYDYTASKTMADGSTITCVFHTVYDDTFSGTKLTITRDVPYDSKNRGTAWSDEIKKARSANLGGHDDVPYFYLGFPEAALAEDKNSGEILLKGAKWDDKMVDEFVSAFSGKSEYKVTSDKANKKARAIGTLTSGAPGSRQVSLYKDTTDGRVYAKFKFKESYSAPSRTDYSESAKTEIKKVFGDVSLPAVYLGTVNPTIKSHPATTYSNEKYVERTGTLWKDKRLEDNKAILEKAGFTLYSTDENGMSHYYGSSKAASLQGYKFLNGSDPSKGRIRFILTRSTGASKDSSYAKCKFWYEDGYTDPNAGATSGRWSDDEANKKTRSDTLGGTLIPYFYAGTEKVTLNSYSQTVSLRGEFSSSTPCTFSSLYNARQTREKAGANLVSFDFSSPKATRRMAAKDGNIITLELACSSSALTAKFTLSEGYISSNAQSDWDEDIKKGRQDTLGYSLPYVYLGAKKPTITADDKNRKVTIKGAAFDKKILSDAETALAADTNLSWTIVNDGTSSLYASASDKDGNRYYLTIVDEDNQPIRTVWKVLKTTTDKAAK